MRPPISVNGYLGARIKVPTHVCDFRGVCPARRVETGYNSRGKRNYFDFCKGKRRVATATREMKLMAVARN